MPGILIVSRIAMALLFILSGAQKLMAPARMAPLFAGLGLPPQTALAVGAFEVIFGLAFVIGFKVRWVAAALAGWCILTAVIGHRFWLDPTQIPDFFKNVALAGAFLAFTLPPRDAAAASRTA